MHNSFPILVLAMAVFATKIIHTTSTSSTMAHHHHGCGAHKRPLQEMEAIQSSIDTLKKERSSLGCKQCINVDTYIRVIQSDTSREQIEVDQDLIDQTMTIVNKAYADSAFAFVLKGTTFHEDEVFSLDWFESPAEAETEAPKALVAKYPRQGDYSTLNMWFGADASEFSFAEFPAAGGLETTPRDGAFNALWALPGYDDETDGSTVVHEIGHWLGIEHVFASYSESGLASCDPNDPGDFVDDTPQMGVQKNETCPSATEDSHLLDTCPLLQGMDPIFNYMDYSSDECQSEFTSGQIERMYYQWSLFRKQDETCSAGHRLFEIEVLPDDFPDEISWQLVSTDNSVKVIFAPSFDKYISFIVGVQDICVDATKDYVFTIFDTASDGLSGGEDDDGNPTAAGYYIIRYDGMDIITKTTDYGASQATSFSGGLSQTAAPVVPATPAPVVSTTSPPTDAPTATVTEAPITAAPVTSAPTGGSGFCFSGRSLVDLQNKGPVALSQVRIGDIVHVGNKKFEPIYSFGHRNEEEVGSILKISFLDFSSTTTEVLELSPDHMVFTKSSGFVPVSLLKVGDTMVNGSGQDIVIKAIMVTQVHGMYAPFTPSGTIVINNVLASSFVALEGKASMKVAGMSMSYHWLAHAFEMPHRVVCHYVSSCPLEEYSAEGISTWVAMPHKASLWILEQPDSCLKSFMLALVVVVFAFFSAIDAMIMKMNISVALCTILAGIVGLLNAARGLSLRKSLKKL